MFTWSPDPELFSLGPFHIRWYGFLFALAFLGSFMVMLWVFRREKKSEDLLNRLFIYVFAAVIVGARLGHCLFYSPEYYLTHPIEILKIWEGGLASHGAAAGILIALALYVRNTRGMTFYWVTDRVSIVIPLAAIFVRLGNFFNSEILGLPASVPWAVIFARVDDIPRHPVQLYEALAYMLIFALMIVMYHRGASARPGRLTGSMVAMLFSARFVLEFFKTGQSTLDPSMPITMGQLLSIPLVAFGLWLLLRNPSSNTSSRSS
ncbi:MAG: prolipoprotein diacylglyceryl transferase [Bacteroidota bacterium]|jgi:prolipoprotein diacylglyceryl transferase|nr:prolipoprotein diacylglyceryl transferase [Bacteroidota bacterium]